MVASILSAKRFMAFAGFFTTNLSDSLRLRISPAAKCAIIYRDRYFLNSKSKRFAVVGNLPTTKYVVFSGDCGFNFTLNPKRFRAILARANQKTRNFFATTDLFILKPSPLTKAEKPAIQKPRFFWAAVYFST